MTLKNWLEQIDIESLSLSTIALWADDDDEEPLFEGCVTDIPWIYLDLELGINDPDDPSRKPVMVFSKENSYGVHMPHFLISVIDNLY